MFQAFVYIVRIKGLHNHPGARAIMAVGGLVADVACEIKLDGKHKFDCMGLCFTAFNFGTVLSFSEK